MQNFIPHFPHWVHYLLPVLIGFNLLGIWLSNLMALVVLMGSDSPGSVTKWSKWLFFGPGLFMAAMLFLLCTAGQLCVAWFLYTGQTDLALVFALLPSLDLLCSSFYFVLFFAIGGVVSSRREARRDALRIKVVAQGGWLLDDGTPISPRKL